MKLSQPTRSGPDTRGERGGSGLNLLIVLLVIGVAAYCTYQYAPVAYKAFLYRDYMQETVNRAAYPPGQTTSWVETQLRAGAKENGLPPDMRLQVQNESGKIVAHVQWSEPVRFPGYVYEYKFDHTARSSGFINPQ